MEHHQNERPAVGQWAEQAKKGMQQQEKAAKQQQAHNEPRQEGGQGDDRTPDKLIGQVAYAQGEEAGGDLRDTKLQRDKRRASEKRGRDG